MGTIRDRIQGNDREIDLKTALAKIAKEILFRSPLRKSVFPRHYYNFTVPQLIGMCQMIEATRNVMGTVAEIGCFNGASTVFFNKYMDDVGIEKPYVAMDTFEGFTAEDIKVEVDTRGKSRKFFTNNFRANSQRWFDATMQWNGVSRARSIKADVNQFDLTTLGPLSFVLLDVDLYRPMKKAFPELYQVMSPGCIMVVDDCNERDTRWDGADQAYKEFMSEIGHPPEILFGKLGIVRK